MDDTHQNVGIKRRRCDDDDSEINDECRTRKRRRIDQSEQIRNVKDKRESLMIYGERVLVSREIILNLDPTGRDKVNYLMGNQSKLEQYAALKQYILQKVSTDIKMQLSLFLALGRKSNVPSELVFFTYSMCSDLDKEHMDLSPLRKIIDGVNKRYEKFGEVNQKFKMLLKKAPIQFFKSLSNDKLRIKAIRSLSKYRLFELLAYSMYYWYGQELLLVRRYLAIHMCKIFGLIDATLESRSLKLGKPTKKKKKKVIINSNSTKKNESLEVKPDQGVKKKKCKKGKRKKKKGKRKKKKGKRKKKKKAKDSKKETKKRKHRKLKKRSARSKGEQKRYYQYWETKFCCGEI